MKAMIRSLAKAVSKRYRSWKNDRIVRKFHNLYYDGPEQVPLQNTISWFGVETWKCPLDLWIYQEILFRTRPDVIVECGVNFGGASLFLAHMCDLLGCGTVVACDITLERVQPTVREHARIELFEGSSTDPRSVQKITERCAGKRVMVILDSDHREEHVREELRLYSSLVTPGCYSICEDTNINGHPVHPTFGPGPYEAVAKFVAENPGWHIDRNCERLLLTSNPQGFLLKQ